MDVVALFREHKFTVLAGILIFFLVRVVKDERIPIPITPRWRPALAVGLGVLVVLSEALLSGASWAEAGEVGAGAAVGAILLHVFGIEVLRGGKELPIPGLANRNGPPAPPAGLAMFALVLLLSGCAELAKPARQIDRGIEILTVDVPQSEPAALKLQKRALVSCKDEACVSEVEAEGKPLFDMYEGVRAWTCDVAPSEECSK
jgi:hypothetical protein